MQAQPRCFPRVSISPVSVALSTLMSGPNGDDMPSDSQNMFFVMLVVFPMSIVVCVQLALHVFGDLLDSIIVDVASECHRIVRLGLERNLDEEEEELRLSAQARARIADPSNNVEANGKYVVDIFGQTHPPVANEIFDCMNCGRSIMAGRFAPHLEKCMGKGRKARLKATRSSTAAQNRYSRGSPVSTYSPYSSTASINRLSNGNPRVATGECSNGTVEEP
ncbi:hypothetical protein RJ640_025949 [Escallonia rubra]|uniref:SAGA-associated factor 11 n=1 Tax=Escallonia rubra TaxID=112253 RepID=A0AA88RTC2_9ASTE|nr:hypothetical protein RJ640_025949 [Escallonia rubra]